jgi:hypothetical protein
MADDDNDTTSKSSPEPASPPSYANLPDALKKETKMLAGAFTRTAKREIGTDDSGTRVGTLEMKCARAADNITDNLDDFAAKFAEREKIPIEAARGYYAAVVLTLRQMQESKGIDIKSDALKKQFDPESLEGMFALGWLKQVDMVHVACQTAGIPITGQNSSPAATYADKSGPPVR